VAKDNNNNLTSGIFRISLSLVRF